MQKAFYQIFLTVYSKYLASKGIKYGITYLDVKSLKFVRNLPGRIIYSIINVTASFFVPIPVFLYVRVK
jgi:hypothetical protein